MGLYRGLPVSHAVSVARALLELANDAVTEDVLPKPMAATISATASDIAFRLETFLTSRGTGLPPRLHQHLDGVLVDFDAIVQFADLVVDHDLTPRNVGHVAAALRYTVTRVLERLREVERELDGCAADDRTGLPSTITC